MIRCYYFEEVGVKVILFFIEDGLFGYEFIRVRIERWYFVFEDD
jgi:hypothetical protein